MAELVRLLGHRHAQRQLTIRDAHCHPVFGGRYACGVGSSHRISDGDSEDGASSADPLPTYTAVAAAMAAVLPSLNEVCLTVSAARTPAQPPTTVSKLGAESDSRGGSGSSRSSRNRPAGSGAAGSGGGSGRGDAIGRPVLAPQPLLHQLGAALLQPGSRDAAAAAAAGLQALCVDYSEPSVDAFEAELLDHHYPHLPLLLMNFAAVATNGGGGRRAGSSGGGGSVAPAAHPILHRRPPPPPPPPPPSPLQQLTSLELRAVAVQPGLLAGLRHLTAVSRLVVSVSCPRPYEPLVTSLPYMTRLTHLHLFLHVPAVAAARQVAGCGGRRDGGVARGRSLEEEGFCEDDSPDCTAVQLAAAVSHCRNLVSLGLPGEDVGGQMPAVLQALPGLTHLAARQLGAWELAAPHTSLRSLSLTMTWPAYLGPLLTSLPRLDTFLADMYIHADAGGGGGGGGGSRRRCRGGDGAGGEAAGAAEQLYDEVLAVTSGLRDVRHVELQLSVMRGEAWEWGRLVRLLAPLSGLRGLTLRMPQADSGPALRAQHFAGLCRQLTGLRRLTLLLAHPAASKLNAKALQALRELPHLELVQLHLGGVWEGRSATDAGDSGNKNGPDSSEGGGGATKGGRNNRSRFRSEAKRDPASAAATSRGGRRCAGGGSGKYDNDDKGFREESTGAADSGGGGGTGMYGGTTVRGPPPLPRSAATLAVMEAARGLGLRGGGGGARGGEQAARRGRRTGVRRGSDGGGSSDEAASSDDGGDASGRSSGDCAGAGDCSDGEGRPSDDDGGGHDGVGRGAGAGDATAGATAAPRAPVPVEFQVDFLTAPEAAAVNEVLRWEGRPAVVVRARLRPRWVWAEASGRGPGGRG